MVFKMKGGSPMKRNFGIGASPAKHKMKVKKGGHGAGGIGRVAPVTAEQVQAHDDKYGEGHDDSHKQPTKAGRVATKIANPNTRTAKLVKKLQK